MSSAWSLPFKFSDEDFVRISHFSHEHGCNSKEDITGNKRERERERERNLYKATHYAIIYTGLECWTSIENEIQWNRGR